MTALGSLPLRPKLSNASAPRDMRVDDWWHQPVMVLARKPLPRRLLVLTAANKDGGAHVDADLPAEYQALVDGIWRDGRTGLLIADHHALCLRQLGYEVLNSPRLVELSGA